MLDVSRAEGLDADSGVDGGAGGAAARRPFELPSSGDSGAAAGGFGVVPFEAGFFPASRSIRDISTPLAREQFLQTRLVGGAISLVRAVCLPRRRPTELASQLRERRAELRRGVEFGHRDAIRERR